MEESKKLNLSYLIFASVLALGFVIGALIMSGTWKKVASSSVTISVTGSASKQIKSDLGIFSASFSSEAPSQTEAYAKLRQTNLRVKEYLINFGFPEDKIVFSSVSSGSMIGNPFGFGTTETKPGKTKTYTLSQEVTIESPDVDKIDKLSRTFSELITQGIDLSADPVEFLYTKLGDLKIEMIGLASQDAKVRAEQIAGATGNKVGDVRSSKTGVIQINAKNSTEISDYGINDTHSLEKTITAVVNVTFAIE